jgi:arylsulfatase A
MKFQHGMSLRLAIVGLAAMVGTKSAAAAPPAKPNFIVINIDDLGYADIGPFGGKHPTPHLDRMAKEGRKLTSYYAAPVCSPSRASLMTGCYPKRVLPIPHVLFPESAVGLHPDEVTIAEVLREAGYATACIGKWHLGDQPEFLPTRQGFDYYLGLPYSNDMGPAAEGAKSNFGKPLPQQDGPSSKVKSNEAEGKRFGQPPLPLLENEQVVQRVGPKEQELLTDRYTARAEQFIREHRDEPFFLYFPHTAVHFPLYPAEKFRDKSGNGLFGDWVGEVDASVGRVLDLLRELKLDEKTLVIFTSDNGGSLPNGSDNTPLRGGKGSTFEGGIRVPTIAWWPGRVPAGTSTPAITSMMDVLPTFATLAGAKLPSIRKLDGVDVSAALLDASDAAPRDLFHYYRGHELQAIRRGPWKLHLAKGELYHLGDDVGETKNVASENAAVVVELRKLADAMNADLGTTEEGPGVRPLGRVEKPRALISRDSTDFPSPAR